MSSNDSSGKKRQRHEDPEYDRCLPIAKRINQLHIRQSFESIDGQPSSSESSGSQEQNRFFKEGYASPLECGPFSSASYPESHHCLSHNPSYCNSTIADPAADMLMDRCNASLPCPSNTGSLNSFSSLQNFCSPYDPELNPNENPFYYRINEQLYYAHMERLSRTRNPSGIQP